MNENNEKKEELDTTPKGVNTKRRSFAKAGVVAPVILTLANRPAWGGVRTMCSVSGFDSAVVNNGETNFSGDVPVDEVCSGVHIRGYWATNGITPIPPTQVTPIAGFDLTNTVFNSVFLVSTNNDSFLVVISGISGRDNDYAGLYVDAVEADTAGLSFPLSPSEVINLYAGTGVDGLNTGWTEAQGDDFVAYLLDHAVL